MKSLKTCSNIGQRHKKIFFAHNLKQPLSLWQFCYQVHIFWNGIRNSAPAVLVFTPSLPHTFHHLSMEPCQNPLISWFGQTCFWRRSLCMAGCRQSCLKGVFFPRWICDGFVRLAVVIVCVVEDFSPQSSCGWKDGSDFWLTMKKQVLSPPHQSHPHNSQQHPTLSWGILYTFFQLSQAWRMSLCFLSFQRSQGRYSSSSHCLSCCREQLRRWGAPGCPVHKERQRLSVALPER